MFRILHVRYAENTAEDQPYFRSETFTYYNCQSSARYTRILRYFIGLEMIGAHGQKQARQLSHVESIARAGSDVARVRALSQPIGEQIFIGDSNLDLALKIVLPSDRTKTGNLTLVNPATGLVLFGPVPVLGRAARDTATAHNNPTGNSLKSFGDTPKGTYDIARIVGNGSGTSRPTNVYGQSGSIVLDPTSGDALTAKNNGRTGLLIHSGRHAFSSVVDAKALKPTNGCIRMLDFDMGQLITAIKNNGLLFPGKVTVDIGGAAGPQGDIDESVDDGDPPPTQGGPVVLP